MRQAEKRSARNVAGNHFRRFARPNRSPPPRVPEIARRCASILLLVAFPTLLAGPRQTTGGVATLRGDASPADSRIESAVGARARKGAYARRGGAM